MHNYLYPMHSVAIGVIFHYKSKHGTMLLLQERTPELSTADNSVSITGGYLNGHINSQGQPENIISGLWREIKEELGKPFTQTLDKKTFKHSNIAYIRQCREQNPAGDSQSNLQFIWLCKITKANALLAFPKDKNEVKNILHIPLKELHLQPCSWLKEVVALLVKSKHLPQ